MRPPGAARGPLSTSRGLRSLASTVPGMTRRSTLRRALTATAVVVGAGLATGCGNDQASDGAAAGGGGAAREDATLADLTIDVRKDPGCGCCTSWVEYLEEHGARVTVTEDPNRTSFRAGRGISDDAASCHTAIVEDYAVEGHVPVAAIQRLLAERPDAAGIALPGMPVDSPGMGGDETTWERQPVMLIGTGGDVARFQY